MKQKMISARKIFIPLEAKRFPMNSGNVAAPSATPMRRVRVPKKMKATTMPIAIFMKTSQSSPSPNCPAIPPKPINAEVLMKAAP